jgi:hypothetical protein
MSSSSFPYYLEMSDRGQQKQAAAAFDRRKAFQSHRGNSWNGGDGDNSPPRKQKSRAKRQDSTATAPTNLSESYFDLDYCTPTASKEDAEQQEVYIVKQRYGYCSILFSIVQCGILAIMMWQCGVAPLNINPMVGPYPDALSDWGGKNAVNILEDGEWWRLLTPILLHAGVIHLLCNVAVQLETGAFFEREWGSLTWTIIYLVSAVGSSILSTIIMPQSISVGSSGAVMGLFGGKLAEVICRCCESKRTEQERIGHDVRKEQCAAVSCSVVLVMAFSFIPYGKKSIHYCLFVCLFVWPSLPVVDVVAGVSQNSNTLSLVQHTHKQWIGRLIWVD